MKAWIKLGSFISSHMSIFVPICVALGVVFPTTFAPLKPFVTVLFAFVTFQGSLSNTFHETFLAFRHPRNLICILLITAVAMPVLAWALASLFFGSNPNLVVGLVLEYSVPVAVTSFIWVSIFSGDGALCLAVVLVSTVASPFTIPATLNLLLGQSVEVDTAGMMIDMVLMIAAPALAGTALNEFSHGWGKAKLSPVLAPASRISTLTVMAANATSLSPYILNMNLQRFEVAVFILFFAISGFIWGILCARVLGLSYEGLATMTFTCGLRNISSGAVIAAQYLPGEAIFPVMCGTLFQQILASFAGNVVRHLGAKRAPEGTQRPGAE